MKLRSFAIIMLFIPWLLAAQTPQVPREMEIVGMQIRFSDRARKKVQEEVDKLTKYPPGYNQRVDRMNLYFPIVEAILREEGVPDDLKYLCILESALIGDAVSVSDAVGYWQFKQAAAQEVGLEISRSVDERMNIVNATRGAATYLKFNNTYFDNWLYAVQSYQMGRGGAEKVVNRKYYGAKRMIIDESTYWYVIKFIAHKIAYEPARGKESSLDYMLTIEEGAGAHRTMKQLANEYQVEPDLLALHNRWLRHGSIPGHKGYYIAIPQPKSNSPLFKTVSPVVATKQQNPETVEYRFKEAEKFPELKNSLFRGFLVNGKKAIKVKVNELPEALASRSGTSLEDLYQYNDVSSASQLLNWDYVYLQKKRRKAKTHYHTVRPGESLWSISQKYGLRMDKLMQKNRMTRPQKLEPGRVLWLRFIRPANTPIEYHDIDPLIQQNQPDVPTETPVEEPEMDETDKMAFPVLEAADVTPSQSTNQTSTPPDSTVFTDLMSSLPTDSIEISKISESQLISSVEADSVIEDVDATDDVWLREGLPLRETTYHIVKKGETLHGLSRKYKIAIADLLTWNDLKIEDGLDVDQKLRVIPPDDWVQPKPAVEPAENEKNMYIVKPGDTLYGICRQFEIPLKDLMEYNSMDSTAIQVGQKIKIPMLESLSN